MIQIGICDDEIIFTNRLEQLSKQYLTEHHIFATFYTFQKGQNLLYEIEDGFHFDLLLLDIEMPEMDGMQLADRIRKLLPDIIIIFITSHTEYALDAYELSIFRYLSKTDLDLQYKLKNALLDAAEMLQVQQNKSYIIQNQNRLERIPYKNLLYVTHEGKNTVLVTNMGEQTLKEFKVRKTIQQVYEELNQEDFFLIDRGCIVNLSLIMSVKEKECILTNGIHLAISQSHMKALKECLLVFWKSHIERES